MRTLLSNKVDDGKASKKDDLPF